MKKNANLNKEKEKKEYQKISAIIDQAFLDAKEYIRKNMSRQSGHSSKKYASC